MDSHHTKAHRHERKEQDLCVEGCRMAAKSFIFSLVSHCSCGHGTDGWTVLQNRVHLVAQT